jgi:hypothetical protein
MRKWRPSRRRGGRRRIDGRNLPRCGRRGRGTRQAHGLTHPRYCGLWQRREGAYTGELRGPEIRGARRKLEPARRCNPCLSKRGFSVPSATGFPNRSTLNGASTGMVEGSDTQPGVSSSSSAKPRSLAASIGRGFSSAENWGGRCRIRSHLVKSLLHELETVVIGDPVEQRSRPPHVRWLSGGIKRVEVSS